MKYLWIFLIALAFAFLAEGDSSRSGHRKEENVFSGLPSESEVTEGDFIGRGPVKRGKSPYAPERGAEMISSNNKDGIIPSKIKILSKSIGAGKSPFMKMVRLLNTRPHLFDSVKKGFNDADRHSLKVKNAPEDGFTTNHGKTVTEIRKSENGRVNGGVQPELHGRVHHKSPKMDTGDFLIEEPGFGYDKEISQKLKSEQYPNLILPVEDEVSGEGELEPEEWGFGESSTDDEVGHLSDNDSSSGAVVFGDDEGSDTESFISGHEADTSEYASGFEETDPQRNTKQPPPIDDYLSFPEDDEDRETESNSSRQKRAAPEHGSGYHESSKRNTKMNTNNAFTMPVAGIRWKGFSMAHVRSRDGIGNTKKDKNTKREGSADGAVTTLSIVFILGGSMFVLLMGIIFLFAMWPIRKYFEYLLSRAENQDVETGQCGEELSSIRVDSNHPSERLPRNGSILYAPQYEQPSGNARKSYEQPRSSGMPQSTQTNGTPNQSGKRSPEKIIAEDKERDSRNAERRKIIKRQTSERRESLIANLLVAKAIIDGHAKNKEFENKASERRQKIKMLNSLPGTSTDQNERRKSFAEQVQGACSVITPNWNDNEKMEQSKEKCRRIKNKIAEKRRSSLLDEIQVARDEIVGYDKKYSYALPSDSVTEIVNEGSITDNQSSAETSSKSKQSPDVDDRELTRLWGWTAQSATGERRKWLSRTGWGSTK